MKTKIVGTQFAKAQAEGLKIGMECFVIHEPENEYDKNALRVEFNGEKLGYIGKGTDLYDIDRKHFPMKGFIVDFLRKVDGDKYRSHELNSIVQATINIDYTPLDENNDVNSFNEEGVVINFDEDSHTYTYNGEKLTGATTYIKKYIEQFNSDAISANCVKYWGVPLKTIKGAWELERDLAQLFGTAIHKALEHEELYQQYIKPKNGERCFNIKHPIIKKIVQEFYELYDSLGFEGEIIPEALVSDVENGLCGLADRVLILDKENKVCRIQDFKVNHSFTELGQEKFIGIPSELHLPPNKLSKLSLQLKFHARMLEKSGWTIDGFDAFVYEDEWKHYEADMLYGFDILTGEIDWNNN